MADDGPMEDYPTEIEENLNDFESSMSSVQNMVQTLVSVSRSDNLLKVCESKCTNQHIYGLYHIKLCFDLFVPHSSWILLIELNWI